MYNVLRKVCVVLTALALAPEVVSAGPLVKKDILKKFIVPFDIPLYQSEGKWKGDFRAYVYQDDVEDDDVPHPGLLATLLGGGVLVGGKRHTLMERTKLFFSSAATNVSVSVSIGGCDAKVKVGHTNRRGMVAGEISLGNCNSTTGPRAIDLLDFGSGHAASAYPHEEGDFGIISDVDDTIKETHVLDYFRALEAQLLDPFSFVTGMPQLFAKLKASMKTPQVYYVTGSPNQLFPSLKAFLQKAEFLPGALITRNFSFWDITRILSINDANGIKKYKTDEIEKIYRRHPKKKFVLIGDSTQADPEVYGDIYRRYKDSVQCIWIRTVDRANNTPIRFNNAFKGVPRTKWKTFQDPSEVMEADVIQGKCH